MKRKEGEKVVFYGWHVARLINPLNWFITVIKKIWDISNLSAYLKSYKPECFSIKKMKIEIIFCASNVTFFSQYAIMHNVYVLLSYLKNYVQMYL